MIGQMFQGDLTSGMTRSERASIGCSYRVVGIYGIVGGEMGIYGIFAKNYWVVEI
jgi:hypothetical protein